VELSAGLHWVGAIYVDVNVGKGVFIGVVVGFFLDFVIVWMPCQLVPFLVDDGVTSNRCVYMLSSNLQGNDQGDC